MDTTSSLEKIDWNEEWRAALTNTSMRKRRSNMTEFWNLKAKRYDQMENMGADRAAQVIQNMNVDDNTSIVDIGCGPGTLTIPLAMAAKSVTAIDPASQMIAVLEEKASNEGLANIQTLNKKWEDVLVGSDLEDHDIVVASYSLVMEDMRSALAKMNAVARTGVCLFWFAGKQTWGYDALWRKLFGEDFVAGPNHMYLVNILHQMGIDPNVETTRRTHRQRFSSIEDAVLNWKENLGVSSPEDTAIIRDHINQILTRESDGLYSQREVRTAMIWWRKENP